MRCLVVGRGSGGRVVRRRWVGRRRVGGTGRSGCRSTCSRRHRRRHISSVGRHTSTVVLVLVESSARRRGKPPTQPERLVKSTRGKKKSTHCRRQSSTGIIT